MLSLIIKVYTHVIEIDMVVAGLPHARGDEKVADLKDERLVDVAAEMVPRVPPHRTSNPEAVVQSARGAGQQRGHDCCRACHAGERPHDAAGAPAACGGDNDYAMKMRGSRALLRIYARNADSIHASF